jgi:hypothetical protein
LEAASEEIGGLPASVEIAVWKVTFGVLFCKVLYLLNFIFNINTLK